MKKNLMITGLSMVVVAGICVAMQLSAAKHLPWGLKSSDSLGTKQLQYVYTIAPKETSCASIKRNILKLHKSGLAAYLPHSGPLSSLRNAFSSQDISLVTFSRSGRYLAYVVGRSLIIVWNVDQQKEQSRIYSRDVADARQLIWGDSDKYITAAYALDSFKAPVWDPVDGREMGRFPDHPLFAAVSPDGKKIIYYSSKYVPNFGYRNSWKLIDMISLKQKDIQIDVPDLSKCSSGHRRLYSGISWYSENSIQIFGFSDSKDIPLCKGSVKGLYRAGLFLIPLEASGSKWETADVIEPDLSSILPSRRGQFNDFTAANTCGYNSRSHFIAYAGGGLMDIQNSSVRYPGVVIKNYNCSFNTVSFDGANFYNIDFRDDGSRYLYMFKTSNMNLEMSAKLPRANPVIGGLDVSPNGKYVAISSDSVIDFYIVD